jgi:hypothetical protein
MTYCPQIFKDYGKDIVIADCSVCDARLYSEQRAVVVEGLAQSGDKSGLQDILEEVLKVIE